MPDKWIGAFPALIADIALRGDVGLSGRRMCRSYDGGTFDRE